VKRILILLVCVVALAPAVFAEDGAKMVDDAWKAAVLAGNLDAVVALYAPDAVMYPPDAMSVVGTEAIRENWTGFLATFTVNEVSFEGRYGTEGDVSWGAGLWKLTVTPKPDGEPMVLEGRASSVCKKIDGKWLYLVDHASMPMPPEEEGDE